MINLHKNIKEVEAMVEDPQPSPTPVTTPRPVSSTPIPQTPAPRSTPQTPTLVDAAEAVRLACRLYNMSRILNLMYQPLYSINFDSVFLSLMEENDEVSTLSLEIYSGLSGNSQPSQNLLIPILGGNVCTGFRTVYSYLEDMDVVALALQRALVGRNFDTQILRIINLINSQKNTVEKRIINCRN